MLRHNKNTNSYTQQNGVEMFQYEIISPLSKHGDETPEENQITDQSLPASSRSATTTFDIEADNTLLKSSSRLLVKKSFLHIWAIKNRPTIVILFVLVGIVISLVIVVWILSSKLSKPLINNHNGAEESPWEKYAMHSRNGSILYSNIFNNYSNVPITGAVATDNSMCSMIGARVLSDGGNAMDAAVASTLCLGVSHILILSNSHFYCIKKANILQGGFSRFKRHWRWLLHPILQRQQRSQRVHRCQRDRSRRSH